MSLKELDNLDVIKDELNNLHGKHTFSISTALSCAPWRYWSFFSRSEYHSSKARVPKAMLSYTTSPELSDFKNAGDSIDLKGSENLSSVDRYYLK